MSDFKDDPSNLSNSKDNSMDNNKLPQNKKPNTIIDLLIGAGISAIAYSLIWFVSIGKFPGSVIALIDFIILAAFGFLTVKFFRKGHTAAAIIMLVLITPSILGLLLLGACMVIGMPV